MDLWQLIVNAVLNMILQIGSFFGGMLGLKVSNPGIINMF